MKITANLVNSPGQHQVQVRTNDSQKTLDIPPKPTGGSSLNGGELLFLALATCYCNDLYREAAKRSIIVERVEVQVQGEFGGEGDPASGITYQASVSAHAEDAAIRDMMQAVDNLTEIQNTLRRGVQVTLTSIQAVKV